jgi:hypothetical protein
MFAPSKTKNWPIRERLLPKLPSSLGLPEVHGTISGNAAMNRIGQMFNGVAKGGS